MQSKKVNLVIFIISLVVFIVSSIILFKNHKSDYQSFDQLASITTTDLGTLKKLFIDKLDYIENNSSLLRPYKSSQIDVIRNKIVKENISLNELGQLNLLTPNSHIDLGPISKPKESPINTTCFQFLQGMAGWYWLYGTFIDKDNTVKSFMFYLIRLETVPEVILKKHNLKPGEATYYYISGGVGNNDKWFYSPYLFVRGKYSGKDKTTFSFEALDMPGNWICKMSSESPQKFSLQYKWKDPASGAMQGFDVIMNSSEPPKFNTPDGCAPCIGGDGTLYWSYTDLKIDGQLLVNNKTIMAKNGVGWMDHQWGSSGLDPFYLRIIHNVTRLFSLQRYLGQYVWINLHLPDKQYLVYTFPTSVIKQNDVYDNIVVNQYASGKEIKYDIKGGKLTVLETINIDNTDYPVKYRLQILKDSYILDAKPFGDCVTIDLTGNYHWSGSALLKSEDNKIIGTAFLEANQLQNPTEYLKVQMKYAGIDDKYLEIFDEKHLSIQQVLPSLLCVLFYLFVFCALIISGIKLVIK